MLCHFFSFCRNFVVLFFQDWPQTPRVLTCLPLPLGLKRCTTIPGQPHTFFNTYSPHHVGGGTQDLVHAKWMLSCIFSCKSRFYFRCRLRHGSSNACLSGSYIKYYKNCTYLNNTRSTYYISEICCRFKILSISGQAVPGWTLLILNCSSMIVTEKYWKKEGASGPCHTLPLERH